MILKYQQKYYRNNKEKVNKRHRLNYVKNRNHVLLKHKQWKLKNKGKLKQDAKEYYRQNKKRIRKANDKWKLKNIERVRTVSRQGAKIRREKITAWWINFKKQYSCKYCGESDPVCLDFHHRNKEDKILAVSQLLWKNNMDVLLKEIEKCDVLCANCHRRWHHFHKEQE